MLLEVTMTIAGISARKIGPVAVVALALSAAALIPSARAQFACPPFYFWHPAYGCVPNNFGAWPGAFPDPAFGFFYGPRWGARWGPGWGVRRGGFRGGFRGGGFRGRGGGRGGGRRR